MTLRWDMSHGGGYKKGEKMVEEKQYKISEMTKLIKVEAHVLRYWEEELQLPIKRNNLGHRYYTQEDVERFLKVRDLKEKGIQLKGIRSMLELSGEVHGMKLSGDILDRQGGGMSGEDSGMKLPASDFTGTNLAFEADKGEKAYRLQMLLKGLVKEAVQESNAEMAEDIKESIIKEMDYQFRIVAEEQEKQQARYQKQQEEYFEKLDYMITDRLQTRKKKSAGILRFTAKGSKKKEA